MAKLLFLSKYPPLEGGIAAKTFWLTRALGQRGHEVHVVTDPVGIDPIHTIDGGDVLPDMPGVTVHRPTTEIPWHIPPSEHRDFALFDTALSVAETHKPDCILSGYLVPYGIIASFLSKTTGIPHILGHGGSDIQKFLLNNVFDKTLTRAISNSNLIITDASTHSTLSKINNNLEIIPPYIPDTNLFSFEDKQKNRKKQRIAFIGKINYFWRHKGIQRIIKLIENNSTHSEFIFLTQGVGIEDFKKNIPEEIVKIISWKRFIPPWDMPTFYNSIDAVFNFQDNLPFPMFSNIILEAFASGINIITDSHELTWYYSKFYIDLSKINIKILNNSISTELPQYLYMPGHAGCLDNSLYEKYICGLEEAVANLINH